MDNQIMKTIALASMMSAGVLLFSTTGNANSIDAVIRVGQARTQAAQGSQVKIDKIADQTRELLQEYKTVMKQVDGLKVYNARLEKQIGNQETRIGSIEESIEGVTVVQRQIMPLTIRMIDALERFVELDVPFHEEERQGRIAFLRNNVDRSDLTTAEKFRQVLEAYKIENEYGRKIDTYSQTIQIDGADREVNILRVGRIAFLYQTTDLSEFGYWDQGARTWNELKGGAYQSAITNGIRMANKQASIDILTIPVAAPEAVR